MMRRHVRSRIVRWVQCATAAGLVAGALASGPESAGATPAAHGPAAPHATVVVRRIDSTSITAVKVDIATPGTVVDPKGVTLRENGSPARDLRVGRLADAKTPAATVLLIDTATSMSDASKISEVKTAAKALVAGKGPSEQMAVVAYGGTSRVVQDLTADRAAITNAIDRLAVSGTPALYAGVRMASNLLINRTDLLGSMVIVGDSGNATKLTTGTDASADLVSTKAMTFVIGLRPGPGSLADLAALASAAHGRYVDAADGAGVTRAFTGVHDSLAGQLELTYSSKLKKGSADLEISAGGGAAAAQLVAGEVVVGADTNPPAVSVFQAPPLLRGKTGLLIIALLVLVAAGLMSYAIVALVTRVESSLTTALRPYADDARGDGADDQEGSLVQTALMQRAVQTTARIAQERGILDRVETLLEQASLALRPAEAILFYAVGVSLLTAVLFVAKGPILGLVGGVVVAVIPPAGLALLARKRLKQFNSQLPDTLQLLASSLRAGFSFLQGVESVAAEVDDPMGGELRRVIIEARLGRPVEEALDECAVRMKSPDFDWAVMAVGIQREVGGNLAELLQTVSVTMVERERLRRDVKALTAEGRMSGIVLGCLPPGLGLFFYVSNPTYMKPLFNHATGQIAVGVATVAMLIGFAWMNKCVQIDV